MTWRSGETNVGPSLTAWISAHPHIIQFIFASLTLCPSYLVNNLPHRPQLPALDPERTLSYKLLNHSYNYESQTIVANHPKYVSSIGSAFLSKLGHRRKGSHHMHKVLTHTDLALSELLWYLQPEKKSREDSEQRHLTHGFIPASTIVVQEGARGSPKPETDSHLCGWKEKKAVDFTQHTQIITREKRIGSLEGGGKSDGQAEAHVHSTLPAFLFWVVLCLLGEEEIRYS